MQVKLLILPNRIAPAFFIFIITSASSEAITSFLESKANECLSPLHDVDSFVVNGTPTLHEKIL